MSFSAWRKKICCATRQTGSFTLVEILVSIGILVILVSMTVIGLGAYKGRTAFDLDANQIVAVLRNAQSRAVSQDRGQGWGVQFTNATTTGSRYALFWGTSYATSSVVSAGTLGYSSVFSDPPPGFSKTIVFAPVTGASAGPDAVAIKNTTSNNVALITVSALGLVGEKTESGLVAYWPMDEGSGANAYDASGNNNNIAFSGGAVTWQAGKAGWAAGMTGVAHGNAASLANAFPNVFTINVWGKNLSTSVWNFFIAKDFWNSGTGWVLGSEGAGQWGWYTPSGQNVATTSPLWADGNWHQIAVTYDGSVLTLYADGAVMASSTRTVLQSTNGIILGARNSNDGTSYTDSGFEGPIDEVRIYNRALSAAEIKNIFNAY